MFWLLITLLVLDSGYSVVATSDGCVFGERPPKRLACKPCRFSEMSMMVESLPIFYTQRDNLFYSAWAFALPTTLLRIPYSLLESGLWSVIVYWSVGLAPTAGRFFTFWLLLFLSHQVLLMPGVLPVIYLESCSLDHLAACGRVLPQSS